MPQQVAPKSTFGFCADCPPTSDFGLAAYHLGPALMLVVVVASLIAGYRSSKNVWLLPLLTMVAVGAIIVQASAYNIRLQEAHAYRVIREYREGPLVSHPNPESFVRAGERLIPFFQEEVREIPQRYRRIFLKGWLAYSVAPFLIGLVFSLLEAVSKGVERLRFL